MFTLFASKGNAIVSHLARMKELAVEMSNPGWSAIQYGSANAEYRALSANITSIAGQGYNNGAVPFGAGGARNINVGRGADIVQTGLVWSIANTGTALGSGWVPSARTRTQPTSVLKESGSATSCGSSCGGLNHESPLEDGR